MCSSSRPPDADPREAVDRLYPLIYHELRLLAQSALNSERPNHTFSPTDLVHELYLRMADQNRVRWENKAHFFAVAGRAIRRILVDYARRRGRQKRGNGAITLSLDDVMNIPPGGPTADLVALDTALSKLAEEDELKAAIVDMRFFAGLTNERTAELLGVSTRTVERHWRYARAWLYRALEGQES